MHALLPCAQGEKNQSVADLHAALRRLGADGPVTEAERAAGTYGEGTQVAVSKLRADNGWPKPAGSGLDQATADRINRLLIEQGILFVAHGAVRGVPGPVPAGSIVFGFDMDFLGGAQLAEAFTTEDATYRMLYDPLFYTEPGLGHEKAKDTLALVISAYAGDGSELARSDVRVDPGRNEEIDLYADRVKPKDPDVNPAQPDDGRIWVIRGIVEDAGGPVHGVVVEAYDRELGDQRQPLGAYTTERDGRFRIPYRSADFAAAEGGPPSGDAPDVVFELHTSADEQPLAFELYRRLAGTRSSSPVSEDELQLGIQASPDEEVAFRVIHPSPGPGIEYQRLMAALEPLLNGRSPGVMDEANHRDVSFAARETGLGADLIAMLVAAHQLADTVFKGRVPADLLYALARCDQHLVDVAGLGLAGQENLSAGIQQAVDRSVIASRPAGDVSDAIDYIVDATPDLLRTGVGGADAFGPVLDVAIADPDAQRALLRAAAGRQDDPRAMWDELRAHPAFAAPGLIERAQLTLQLDALTGHHLPLVKALIDRHVTSPQDLLKRADLVEIVREAGVPEGIPGDADEHRAANYAAAISNQLHQAFPTLSVAQCVAATPSAAVGGAAVRTALAGLLNQAGQPRDGEDGDFNIGTTHLDSYIAEHHDRLFAGVDDDLRAQLVDELKRTQRLYRVSTSPAAMTWLLAQQHKGAFDIARYSPQHFVEQAGPAFGAAEAAMVHSRAQAIADAVVATHLQLLDLQFSDGLSAVSDAVGSP